MSDPSLRDRCIEAAARADHDAGLLAAAGHPSEPCPQIGWTDMSDELRALYRAEVTPLVDAVLAEVAAHAEAEMRHPGPRESPSYYIALEWIANECRTA